MTLRINFSSAAQLNRLTPKQPDIQNQTPQNDVEPAPDPVDDEPALAGGTTLNTNSRNALLQNMNMLGQLNMVSLPNQSKIDTGAKNYSALVSKGLSDAIISKYFSKEKTGDGGSQYVLNSKYDGYSCKAQSGTHAGQPYTHIFTVWTINPDGSRKEIVEYINNPQKTNK